jgi:hypothetical protein
MKQAASEAQIFLTNCSTCAIVCVEKIGWPSVLVQAWEVFPEYTKCLGFSPEKEPRSFSIKTSG